MAQNNTHFNTPLHSTFLGSVTWPCAAIYRGLSELDKLQIAGPAGRSRSPYSLCQICSATCFRFVSMTVRQRGVCHRNSVGIPYISVLLAMQFTTPEIPFFLTKWSFSIVEDPVHSARTGKWFP